MCFWKKKTKAKPTIKPKDGYMFVTIKTDNGFEQREVRIPNEDSVIEKLKRKDSIDGITKRELFAAMSMQGLNAVDTMAGNNLREHIDNIAKYSVMYADALINELNKQQ